MKLNEIIQASKISESNLIITLWKRLMHLFVWKQNILSHNKVEIKYAKNIQTNGLLKIGMDYYGFKSKYDRTFFNIRGKLIFNGDYSIGKGCRLDIGPNAIVVVGIGGYMSPDSTFIISNGLTIGNDCAISWGCQFLDEDFHTLQYEGKKMLQEKKITIGDHVWIGSKTSIYKGVNIPTGCVVAGNSVVKNSFFEENVLIGGNPARILKRDISWIS